VSRNISSLPESRVFLGPSLIKGKTHHVFLSVRLEFTTLFCRLNQSINYSVWTVVRLFVALRGQSGGPIICFEYQ
jgi:hypothetical protein